MKAVWKHVGIGVVAAVLVAVGATAITFLLVSLNPVTLPESNLPADKTVAVTRGFSPAMMETLRRTIPSFAGLPAFAETDTVALLEVNGETQWIMFHKEGTPTASNPQILNLLKEETGPRLGGSLPYLALHASAKESDGWLFVRSLLLQPLLPSLRAGDAASHVAIGMSESGTTLSLLTTRPSAAVAPLPPSLTVAISTPEIVLESVNGKDLLSQLGSLTDPDTRIAAGSLLAAQLQQRFGPDMSAVHDVLPLLSGPVHLELGKENGRATFLASITGERDELATFVSQAHTLFSARMPALLRERVQLDKDFAVESVRRDDSSIVQEESTVNGWSVRETSASGAGLVTASRGTHVILGSDPAAVGRMVNGQTRTLALSTAGFGRTLLHAGMVDRAKLQNLLSGLPNSPLTLLLPDAPTLLWTVERDDLSTIISIRPVR